MIPAERSVVVTGASSGIGRACALHLDARGWRVFAGVRKAVDRDSLQAEASDRLTAILLDVSRPVSVRRAQRLVEKSVGPAGLFGLVNNAGVAYGGPVEFLDLEELRGAFDVNFFGMIAVTQAFMPALRRAQGRIVNMSSNSGLVAAPFLTPYSASKWAVEALSDALRVEVDPWRIRVAVIEPGAIDTPIWQKGKDAVKRIKEGMPAQAVKLYGAPIRSLIAGLRPHGIPATRVARAVEQALTDRWPRSRYVVGMDAALTRVVARLPDGVRDALFKLRLRGKH